MRSTMMAMALPVLLAGFGSGCKGKGGTPSTGESTPPTTTASAPPAASASAPAPAGSGKLASSGKMAHCPNAVTGVTTTIADVPGGVEVGITGADPAAIGDVQARVQALLEVQKNQSANIKHTGTGEGGGLLGRCPIVLKDTEITAAAMAGGSKVTVKTKDAQEVDWLRRETRDREKDLETAGIPAGAGKMSHCPSAVENAKTTVKNTKDGVAIVVVAGAGDGAKEIRDRAKHLADVSKALDAGAAVASHTGTGGGGGGVGRCPVVLKDTLLVTKEVTGGAEIDVKAKAVADVLKLQDESKERAAKFQLASWGKPGAPAMPGAPGAH